MQFACSLPSHHPSESWLVIIPTLRRNHRWKSVHNAKTFLQGNMFVNIICKRFSILSGPPSDNWIAMVNNYVTKNRLAITVIWPDFYRAVAMATLHKTCHWCDEILVNFRSCQICHYYSALHPWGGGVLNTNMSFYQYTDPYVKDNTVSRPFYL